MAVYLVQHGLSRPKTEDPEQGLSEQGKNDTRRIADVAKGYGVPVRLIRHSPKPRAIQTAEILNEILEPPKGAGLLSGINPMDPVEPVAASLDPGSGIMLVGHLPFLERLTSILVTGSPDVQVFRFQNSGIVCLDRQDGNWTIRWTLMPNIG